MIRRSGMALVATIAVVSLIAILGVATLSLSSRLKQGSSLTLRAARLDAAAMFGLGSTIAEWRPRSLGQLAIGATQRFAVEPPGSPAGVVVSVTRVDAEIFWTVVEVTASDGSMRRENLLLRVRRPRADAVTAADSSNVGDLDGLSIDSLATEADVAVPAGASWVPVDGVIHAAGDLFVAGGSATGILIVEGRLFIAPAFVYSGIVVARGGIEASGAGNSLTGAVRVSGGSPLSGTLAFSRSVPDVEVVLSRSVRPRIVAGRAWSELY
jgi:hypothetical protein